MKIKTITEDSQSVNESLFHHSDTPINLDLIAKSWKERAESLMKNGMFFNLLNGVGSSNLKLCKIINKSVIERNYSGLETALLLASSLDTNTQRVSLLRLTLPCRKKLTHWDEAYMLTSEKIRKDGLDPKVKLSGLPTP